MNNIYEDRKNVHFLCLEPRETDKNVLKLSWNFVNISSWNFTSCFWERWIVRCFYVFIKIYFIFIYVSDFFVFHNMWLCAAFRLVNGDEF